MRVACLLALLAFFSLPAAARAQSNATAGVPRIDTHDNLKGAGQLRDGVLSVSLRAGVGNWYPEGASGRPVKIGAFGEDGAPLTIPSPLIRVPAGTVVRLSLHNTLDAPLRVTGFCDRPGPCQPVTVTAGGNVRVEFKLNLAGTFHYWATTGTAPFDSRVGDDSQLGGAIVVDPPGVSPGDRVFVMGLKNLTPASDLTVINGRSWPLTEHLAYKTGDVATWRVINLTSSPHAMHLHGFYFRVDSTGDGVRDVQYGESERRLAVTEQMPPGRTMTIAWVPERAGNWLFHCHMLVHMMPDAFETPGGATGHSHAVSGAGMSGLVLGITVTGGGTPSPATPDSARRRLQLVISPDTRHGETRSYKVSLETGREPAPRVNERAVPGPVMVLTRGEPVAVEVVNHLSEPTAIHWHGIELESYDDGVPDFGGTAGATTPAVGAGGTFVARFTPPRAGTFIYHTHWHNAHQLSAGLYGPLIVLEPGQRYDPVTDHLVVLGLDGDNTPPPNEPIVVNGDRKPRSLDLKAGVRHRLRFINITPDNVAFTVQLSSGFDPIEWTLVAKDGADLPPAQATPRRARQLVSIGETYDFELAPMPAGVALWMELRRGTGEQLLQWPVRVQ